MLNLMKNHPYLTAYYIGAFLCTMAPVIDGHYDGGFFLFGSFIIAQVFATGLLNYLDD